MKPEETNAIDFLSPATAYVNALSAECASDPKAFYKTNRGSERARAAIAALANLQRRLEQFNRA